MERMKWSVAVCVAVILFIFGTAMLFSTGILIFNGRNSGIDLPEIETINRIEMGRKYDWLTYSSGVVFADRNEIDKIMSVLYGARKPIVTSFLYWTRTANEVPGNRTHLSVSFGGSPIFLYTQGNNGYVYVPYVGLYRVNKNRIEELIHMYENNGEKGVK